MRPVHTVDGEKREPAFVISDRLATAEDNRISLETARCEKPAIWSIAPTCIAEECSLFYLLQIAHDDLVGTRAWFFDEHGWNCRENESARIYVVRETGVIHTQRVAHNMLIRSR